MRGGLGQQTHLPMPGVVTQGHRRPVRPTNSALGAEDQIFIPAQLGRIPPHGSILGPPEDIAAGGVAQPFGLQGQVSGRPGRMRFYGIQFLIGRISLIFIHV